MSISFAHLNVRSLSKNFQEFRDHVEQNKYDVIAVTETWLSTKLSNDNFRILNYSMIRKDRDSLGGGVAFYVKNPLKFSRTNYDTLNQNFEHLWIRITIDHKKFLVGVIYKNKYDATFIDNFEDVISLISPDCDQLLCLGDFNINLLNFDNKAKRFLSAIESYGLYQIITAPTRVSKTSLSLLDLIIVSDKNIYSSCGVKDIHISDHALVYCELPCIAGSQDTTFRTSRDFSQFDYDSFYADLQSIRWEVIYRMSDINQKVTLFNTILTNLLNAHAPYKTYRFTKPFAPWLTDNIKKMMSIRDAALKRYRVNKSPNTWEYYKSLRNYTNLAVKNEKKAYIQHFVRTNPSKNIWKSLNKLGVYAKVKTNLPANLDEPNLINDYFISVFQNADVPNGNIIDYYNSSIKTGLSNKFSFALTNYEEVVNILNTIKTNAIGSDGINIKLIKLCCPIILNILVHIYNVCIEKGVFPSTWKNSLVIPIPKVNNPTGFHHLRPVSILPAISKIFEKILERQIRTYLERCNIIPEVQSGFRPGHSCTTALLEITDEIIKATDNRYLTALVLLDFSKAFDTINHSLLIAILHFIGFDNSSTDLIKQYLSGRTQQVVVNNNMSFCKNVTSGVPQGSVLGPLLFTIYTFNFISSLQHCSYHLYADDMQIYYSFPADAAANAEELINRDLNNLYEFSKAHCLSLNPLKSVAMLFGPANIRQSIQQTMRLCIKDSNLDFKETVRNLGVILDNELRFREHINNCLIKSFANLKLLYTHKNILNKKIKVMLCDSLVLSHFNFADCVYGPCIDTITSRKIQKVQNSCLRFIYSIRRRNHVSHKLVSANWLNMYNRRLVHASCLYFKIILLKCPPYLLHKIRYRTDVHNINLRSRGNVTIPKHRTQLFKRSFSYQIALVYNRYIDMYVTCRSIISFKKNLFNLLLKHQ